MKTLILLSLLLVPFAARADDQQTLDQCAEYFVRYCATDTSPDTAGLVQCLKRNVGKIRSEPEPKTAGELRRGVKADNRAAGACLSALTGN